MHFTSHCSFINLIRSIKPKPRGVPSTVLGGLWRFREKGTDFPVHMALTVKSENQLYLHLINVKTACQTQPSRWVPGLAHFS